MRARTWFGLPFILLSALAHADTTIYRCETPAGLVFSDRPCAPEAQIYEPDLSGISVMESQVPKPTPVVKSVASPQVRVASGPAAPPKIDACLKLNEALRKIASTLRSGYSAKQGERLNERKRELEAKRRAQKC